MIEFEVTTDPRGVVVVAPHGRLNMVSARQLRELLAGLVTDGRLRIVVDLDRTTFLDSSGLGALIAGLKTVRQAGGDLQVARPRAEVMSVFELSNLDRVLRPRATVDETFGG